MCINFIDVNRAFPFPLPMINMLVDATAGHEKVIFLHALSGYNHILMHPDEIGKKPHVWDLLLQRDAIPAKECRGYIPMPCHKDVQDATWEDYAIIY